MSEKLNIIYDADILTNGLKSNSGRSGIYFVAYNILKTLCKELRQEYSNKGQERAKQFSWEKCTQTMIDIMKSNM